MKRFIIIFLSLSLVETGVFFSPIRIEKKNPDAKWTLSNAIDTLNMNYDGHILVEIHFKNDTTGHWFLWDTGAQASFIDEELIHKHNFQEIGLGRSVDTNLKARQTIRYKVDSLTINNALFEDFIFSGLYIEKPKCGEKRYRGIIGANIISKVNWMIDYEGKKLFMINPDSAESALKLLPKLPDTLSSYTISFNSRSSRGVPKVNMHLKGELVEDVIFDTGYSGSIVLPMKIYDKSDFYIDSASLKSYGEVSKGLFGTATGDMVQVNADSIKLSGHSLEEQTINFQSKTVKLLGNKVLKNYFVYLKYNIQELELFPRPGKKFSYTVKRRGFGFGFKPVDDVLKVTMVQENSPADNAGLEYEDEILCINEAQFQGDECNVNEWYSNFICETILLEVKDKGTLELEFER